MLKEVEPAGVRREGDGIHSSLRARVWSYAEAARAPGAPGPGVGGLREVQVRAGAGGGGACAASPWRAARGATLGVRASPSPRPGPGSHLEENAHGSLKRHGRDPHPASACAPRPTLGAGGRGAPAGALRRLRDDGVQSGTRCGHRARAAAVHVHPRGNRRRGPPRRGAGAPQRPRPHAPGRNHAPDGPHGRRRSGGGH